MSKQMKEPSRPTFPQVVCVLDLETAGPQAIKPDRADLAVVGLKVYTWDSQRQGYLPGLYEYYVPTDFASLQQRLDMFPGPIVGHNLFNFDYLVLRRHLNLDHVIKKSADTLHLLYEMGGGGEEGSLYGLDQLAKENFGERKTAKASTIPKLLKDGKLAEVLVYNERDCDLTFRLWWKMVSERSVATGEILYDDEGPSQEVTYDLEEEQVSTLTCSTPRFTHTTWVEQLERDGWIVMPPPERRRREKERERQSKERWEAANTRRHTMQEFITQHLCDDISHKYVPKFDWHDREVPLDFEATRALLRQTDLPGSAWVEEVVCRLLRGEQVSPAELKLAGRVNSREERDKLIKGILVVLIADGYTPRYDAFGEPDNDSISLANPPPTLAEQYVNQNSERYFELELLYDPAGIEFEFTCVALGVHQAYTKAMNSLRGGEHLVFTDESYVLNAFEVDFSHLQPQVLTSEERSHLEAYTQDHPEE